MASWGAAFVALLLVSAGMVTVPGGDDDVAFVRQFYTDHRAVVVTAQVVGLAASAAFLPFALGLVRQRWVLRRRPVLRAGGVAVALAGVLAGLPPLALCLVAGSAGAGGISTWATASDLVDVVLFTVIALFAVAVAMAVDLPWLRGVAVVVGLVSAARAVLVLLGKSPLELVAPIGFLCLVGCLSVLCWRRAAPPS